MGNLTCSPTTRIHAHPPPTTGVALACCRSPLTPSASPLPSPRPLLTLSLPTRTATVCSFASSRSPSSCFGVRGGSTRGRPPELCCVLQRPETPFLSARLRLPSPSLQALLIWHVDHERVGGQDELDKLQNPTQEQRDRKSHGWCEKAGRQSCGWTEQVSAISIHPWPYHALHCVVAVACIAGPITTSQWFYQAAA